MELMAKLLVRRAWKVPNGVMQGAFHQVCVLLEVSGCTEFRHSLPLTPLRKYHTFLWPVLHAYIPLRLLRCWKRIGVARVLSMFWSFPGELGSYALTYVKCSRNAARALIVFRFFSRGVLTKS